jgi:hypothetical protein
MAFRSRLRHDPNAIECFLLLTFPAYNLFHAFFALNLKAAARNDKSQVLWARLMTAEFLHEMASINPHPDHLAVFGRPSALCLRLTFFFLQASIGMPPGQIWAFKTSCESPRPSHPHPNPSEHSATGLRSLSVAESLLSPDSLLTGEMGVQLLPCLKSKSRFQLSHVVDPQFVSSYLPRGLRARHRAVHSDTFAPTFRPERALST